MVGFGSEIGEAKEEVIDLTGDESDKGNHGLVTETQEMQTQEKPSDNGKAQETDTDAQKTSEQENEIRQIELDKLVPFRDHPFKVTDDDAMKQAVESISEYGVLTPLIARPLEDGSYEIISGHRRAHAAELAGLSTVPVIVRQMDDDAATVLMVDSNLQREQILPSEKAFAYKLKMEALKHQGKRVDLERKEIEGDDKTSRQVVDKLKAAELMGKEIGESGRQVQRYIRLTHLIPELLDDVDQGKISLNPAVELSYLTPEEQHNFMDAMDETQAAPSLSQAQRMKKQSQENGLSLDGAREIMNELKKGDLERVTFRNEQLRKYFPSSYTALQMQEVIIKLLDQWQKKKQRDMER